MYKHEGKIGTIRRNVQGRACSSCGSHSYQLILRSVKEPNAGKLVARCSQCQRLRQLSEDLERILWM
jgi:predicted RNA-binding Zn-ribbon protein involved in translation (DUF1610 family)